MGRAAPVLAGHREKAFGYLGVGDLTAPDGSAKEILGPTRSRVDHEQVHGGTDGRGDHSPAVERHDVFGAEVRSTRHDRQGIGVTVTA